MYDLSRMKGPGAAIAAVTLALAGSSLVAQVVAGGRPAWLTTGDSTVEGGQDRIVGGRIKAAARQALVRPLDDLGVVLGASAVGMGIDPTRLEAAAGPQVPARWLTLYANGANVSDLEDLGELVLTSGLRPRVYVFGLHPGLLARSDNYLSDRMTIDLAGFRQELAGKHLIQAKEELEAVSVVPVNVAFPNRTRVSNRIRGLSWRAKRRLFTALGMNVEALYPADKNPWGVKLLVEDADEVEVQANAEGRKATVRDQAEGPMREGLAGPVKDKGWNDPGAYEVDGANARSLVVLIEGARRLGSKVVIALLPESSGIRRVIPPEAMTCLSQVLDRRFGPDAPPVIDLRDALTDEEFHDGLHPNKLGRTAETDRLAEALRALRPSAKLAPAGR